MNTVARRGYSSGAALIALLLVCGCTATTSPPPWDVDSQPQVETVIERTITDAVSLDATSEAGVEYTITARGEGRLHLEERPSWVAPATHLRSPGGAPVQSLPVSTAVHLVGLPAPVEPPTDDAGGGDPVEGGGEESEHLDPKRYIFWFTDANGTPSEIGMPETATHVIALVPLDTPVEANTPLLQVTDAAIVLRSEPTPEQAMRIGTRVPNGVRAQVKGSSGPFDCAPTDQRLSLVNDQLQFTCRAPASTPLVVGASAKVVLVLETKEKVSALPVEAVAGSISNGYVYRDGSGLEQVPVELGISDGVYVEIVSGLSVGDQVLVPSPSLLEDDSDQAD